MQLGRNEGRNRRAIANSDAGDVAAENIIVPMINVMVTGVTGSRDCANFKRSYRDGFVVFENFDLLGRNRPDFPPKSFHFVAKDTGRRFDEFCRIDQVLRAARMNVNSRARTASPARTCESPSCARVIEMD